ncbi:MAG: tetratricopeptide repeat protein, partial [Planctomycetota bacterium]
GRLNAADTMIQAVLSRSGNGHAPRVHINALRTLRKIRDEQRRYDEAFEIAKECREYSASIQLGEIFSLIHVDNEYAISAMKIGKKVEAEKVVRESLNLLERDHPQRKFVIANTKHRLAEILLESGQFEEAKQLATDFIEMQKITLGENDPYVIRGLVLLAEIHRRGDDLLVAEQIGLEAVDRVERLEHDQLKIRRSAQRELAKILEKLDLERANLAWDVAIQYGWQYLGGDVSVANDLLRRARILDQLQRSQQAAECVKRAVDILEQRRVEKSELIQAYEFYIRLLEQNGQLELALEYVTKIDKLDRSAGK